MKITLVAYAMIREAFKDDSLEYEVPEGTTTAQLVSLLSNNFPEIAEILKYTRIGQENDYLDKTSILKESNEYFLIPPVSGG